MYPPSSCAAKLVVPNHHDLKWWSHNSYVVAFLLRRVEALTKSIQSNIKHHDQISHPPIYIIKGHWWYIYSCGSKVPCNLRVKCDTSLVACVRNLSSEDLIRKQIHKVTTKFQEIYHIWYFGWSYWQLSFGQSKKNFLH